MRTVDILEMFQIQISQATTNILHEEQIVASEMYYFEWIRKVVIGCKTVTRFRSISGLFKIVMDESCQKRKEFEFRGSKGSVTPPPPLSDFFWKIPPPSI